MRRPKLVQAMMDRIKRSAEYHDGVPKSYMRPAFESGEAEYALLAYIENLEKAVRARARPGPDTDERGRK